MSSTSRLSRYLTAGAVALALAAGTTLALAQSKALRIGTSSSGSIYYTLAVGLSTMLTKQAAIAATAEPVGGSSANIFALGADKVDLAIINAGAAYDGYQGLPPFKRKAAIGLIAQGQLAHRQLIVRVGSGIDSPADLVGKTIIGKRPALPETEKITNALLKVYNIDPGKVKIISTTNTGEVINALKSDTVDGAVIPGGRGASYLRSLAEDGKIKFIEIPDDKIKAMQAMLPKSLLVTVLPANTYKGQTKAIKVFSLSTYLVAASRVSDQTVYEVTKTLFNHIAEFHTFHGTARAWTLEHALTDPGIPFHPGAIRYFKEKKVWTPELEKLQAELKN